MQEETRHLLRVSPLTQLLTDQALSVPDQLSIRTIYEDAAAFPRHGNNNHEGMHGLGQRTDVMPFVH